MASGKVQHCFLMWRKKQRRPTAATKDGSYRHHAARTSASPARTAPIRRLGLGLLSVPAPQAPAPGPPRSPKSVASRPRSAALRAPWRPRRFHHRGGEGAAPSAAGPRAIGPRRLQPRGEASEGHARLDLPPSPQPCIPGWGSGRPHSLSYLLRAPSTRARAGSHCSEVRRPFRGAVQGSSPAWGRPSREPQRNQEPPALLEATTRCVTWGPGALIFPPSLRRCSATQGTGWHRVRLHRPLVEPKGEQGHLSPCPLASSHPPASPKQA